MRWTILPVLIILITGCGNNIDTPSDLENIQNQVNSGTSGLEMRFLQGSPPNTIFDQTELFTNVEIHNRGSTDLGPAECFVKINGFDPNIIGGDYLTPKSCSGSLPGLEGKSIYNPQGMINNVEFRSRSVRLPRNTDRYNPNLKLTSCYKYETKTSPNVCVDPAPFQNTNQKSCQVGSVPVGGGQGGPVGVSSLNVDMVGDRAIVRAQITNFGNGQVLSSNVDLRNCDSPNMNFQQLNRVRFNMDLSGGQKVQCTPSSNEATLVDGRATVTCTFMIGGESEFTTPLNLELDYSYRDSITKQIEIIKTPR